MGTENRQGKRVEEPLGGRRAATLTRPTVGDRNCRLVSNDQARPLTLRGTSYAYGISEKTVQ
jgi:hypothetical protein